MRSIFFSVSVTVSILISFMTIAFAADTGPQIQFHPVRHASVVIESNAASNRMRGRSIRSGVVHGDFPKRALRLVLEWMDLHQQELLD